MHLYFITCFIIAFMTGSSSKKKALFTIENTVLLEYLPSGSAMAVVQEELFIAGDDSPFLFRLNSRFELLTKLLLLDNFAGLDRIPKATKPDFESMAEEASAGGTVLYIFGSGSKTPERDQMLYVPLLEPGRQQAYPLTSLYNRLAALQGGGRENLNLEGAFIYEEKLYLLNRSGNQLVSVLLEEFKKYLQGIRSAEDLELSATTYQLPGRANVQAGFSGACTLPGSSKIIFTATMEDTDNWIDDGKILGSYMGILDLQQPTESQPLEVELLKTKENTPLPEKIESVSFHGFYENGDIKLLAVADNDDGSTRLFEVRLRKEFF